MKISDETKVGILATVAITILILGYNFLRGNDLFSKHIKLYAVYDKVDGLHRSDPVILNGLKVGSVSGLHLQGNNLNRVLVEFDITMDVDIPKDTRAVISSADILGSKAIALELGSSAEFVKDDDTLASHTEESLSGMVSSQILPVKIKAENLLASLDTVLIIIESIFNPETRTTIQKGVFNMKETLENINHTTKKFDEFMGDELKVIFANVAVITQNFAELNEHVTNITSNFSMISDSIAYSDIAGTINNANKSLKEFAMIMEKIEKGEGTIGQLVTNDSLYNNLNSSALELSLLLEELQIRPKKYLGPLGHSEKKIRRQERKDAKNE